jgi:hypothetical protein
VIHHKIFTCLSSLYSPAFAGHERHSEKKTCHFCKTCFIILYIFTQ